ncbi:hypothetical protein AVEN_150390-1 [Araneus ventricosus]|uniref:Uncharacterized protein n=1 Tax=Araneus ventricosus TaxID=182803 RepID=A0A4Y2QSI5_ARAVE|nr:hypothetical protein AVEN_150390-1 [Araneus ventricosus]
MICDVSEAYKKRTPKCCYEDCKSVSGTRTQSSRDNSGKSFCPVLWKQTSSNIYLRLRPASSTEKRSRIATASSLNPTLFFIALAFCYPSSQDALLPISPNIDISLFLFYNIPFRNQENGSRPWRFQEMEGKKSRAVSSRSRDPLRRFTLPPAAAITNLWYGMQDLDGWG